MSSAEGWSVNERSEWSVREPEATGLPGNFLVHLIHPQTHKHQTQHGGPDGFFVGLPGVELAAQPYAYKNEREQLEGHAAVTYVIVGGLRHWLRVSPRAAHS